MAESDGLENRCGCTPTVGSNPTPSADCVAGHPGRLSRDIVDAVATGRPSRLSVDHAVGRDRLACPATRGDSQAVRSRSAALDLVAASAGTTAITFAATSTPAASSAINPPGTTDTGMTPRLLANAVHTALPTRTPRGTPTMIPMTAKRGRLPQHGGRNLTVHEAHGLQKADVSSPA